MIKKFCLKCGKEFNVAKHRKDSAKFCSKECKHAFGRVNKICLFCGKSFESAKWLNKSFCSRKCLDESKKRRVTKKCQLCGKEYEVQKYLDKTSKYCSFECRNEGVPKGLIGRFRGIKSPSYKGGKIWKTCKHCGKIFKVHQYRKNTANHCSVSCSKLDTSEKTRKQIAESIKKLQKENPKIHPNYILAQKGHVTQIERLVKDELNRRNLTFKIQYHLLSYWIDFAFPEIKLAVECDGKRWHSTKENIIKDNKRDERIRNKGWIVLRLKESEILKDVKKEANKIENFINTKRGEGGFGSTGHR